MKRDAQVYETWKRDYLDGMTPRQWVERGLLMQMYYIQMYENDPPARRGSFPPPPSN